MDLSEIFDRYEFKLKKKLEFIMRTGANSLVRECAMKCVEYSKIFNKEVR